MRALEGNNTAVVEAPPEPRAEALPEPGAKPLPEVDAKPLPEPGAEALPEADAKALLESGEQAVIYLAPSRPSGRLRLWAAAALLLAAWLFGMLVLLGA